MESTPPEVSWNTRYQELDRMTKRALARHYRTLGYVWSKHPPESWRKDEIIKSILNAEGLGYTPDEMKPTE